ncbi:MAG: ATP-binding protein [Hydrogenobacter sp.]|uniref:sensor histidine kinase n=1 Tax=Hydrogenobacter thermophilus TaxID=940 RepID=UPI0030FD1A6A
MSILSEFLREVDEGYAVIGTSGRLIYANSFMISKSILKRDCEGKPYYECIKVLSLISAVAEGLSEKRRVSVSFEHEDVEYKADIFPTGDGILVRLTDITQFKRYERSKKEFIANISHELKTPIAIINSILETLLEEEKGYEKRRMIERALRRTQEMKNIVDDLLIITRLESGEEKLHKRIVNLKELVNVVFDMLKEIADSSKVELLNTVDENVNIYADEEKMSLLLLNLVDNAIKYNRKNGKVIVRGCRKGDHVLIEVSDTGIGIPKEHIPFIFERFYRVDRSRSRELGGTGLGLSIVKHVALSHGGKVEVDSKEGEGSTFRVYIPQSM